MAYLILADQHREIDRRELTEPVTVGRSPECAIQVRDAILSRQHCRFEPMGNGRWVVTDLNSRNGTFVGSRRKAERVTRHILEDGEVVRIGRTRVCYRSGPFVAKRSASRSKLAAARPVDPHEALAGTVMGFSYSDMEEESRISGFPIPKPQPVEPTAYRSEKVGALVSQLASQSWDTSVSARPQVAKPPRAASRATPLVMVDLSTTPQASTTPATSTAARRIRSVASRIASAAALTAASKVRLSRLPSYVALRDGRHAVVVMTLIGAALVCTTSLVILLKGWR